MRSDFAAFILTHGRHDRQYTLDSLVRSGYTGKYFLIIDNEDRSAPEYYKRFGEKVIMFDKAEIAKTFDTADNFSDRRTIVYARNACFGIAQKLGIRYFLELDDDYTSFNFRYAEKGSLRAAPIKHLDLVFDATLELLDKSGAATIAFAQSGDSIGGLDAKTGGAWRKKVLRKAMNTFFCDVEKPIKFVGRINEDVNTYTSEGSRGRLFLTVTDISINQKQTQSNKGGMTDIYLESGTYLKSFYTVLFCPSFATVQRMGGNTYHRIHHRIDWNHGVPKIISERYKKT